MSNNNGHDNYPVLGRVDWGALEQKVMRVPVPELGGSIILRRLDAGTVTSLNFGDADNIYRQILLSIIDEQGQPVYQNNDTDLAIVKKMPAPIFQDVLKAHNELNGVSRETQEEIKKN